MLVDVPAGYVFARMRFPGRDLLFAVVIASLIVPDEILLVPNYVTDLEARLAESTIKA